MSEQHVIQRFSRTGAVVLAAVGAGALAFVFLQLVRAFLDGSLSRAFQAVPVSAISLACAAYLFGHAFRCLRLALLIGGWRVSLRRIVSVQFMTAAIGLAMPLKLGDVYRVAILSRLIGSLTHSIEIVWWERLLDAITLIVIMLTALQDVPSGGWHEFAGIIASSGGFIVATLLVFFVLPDNLRRTSIFIIRRYDNPKTIAVLQNLDRARRAILVAPRMLRGKAGSLATLTVLVWSCEIGAFAFILAALGQDIASAPDNLLKLLSVAMRGHTLFDKLNVQAGLGGQAFTPYFAATEAPLVIMGLVATVSYLVQRERRR